jgi:eukaryotic-like serine/threonine-protein kinase
VAATLTHIGEYRVLDPLSTSAAVDVLVAEKDGTKVVARILAETYSRHARFAEAFERGARAYERLTHPCIASLREVLRVEARLAVVIERVDGAPLSRVGALDDPGALHVGASLFAALAAAHAVTDVEGAPVLHRYLSPSKVLLGWDGTVKVRDFALPEAAKLNVGAVGIARGAERYMAPEQVKGGDVTVQTDVYCGGLILWELLTRQRAFEEAKRAIDSWRAMGDPKLAPLDELRPDVDPRIHDVVRRALAPRAEERSVTAAEIAALLRELVPDAEGRARVAASMAAFRSAPLAPKPLPAKEKKPAPAPPKLPRMPLPSGARSSSARMRAAAPMPPTANVSERSHVAMPPPPPEAGSERAATAEAPIASAATSEPPVTAATTAPPPATTTTAPPAVTVSLPIIIGPTEGTPEVAAPTAPSAPEAAPAPAPQPTAATRRGPAFVMPTEGVEEPAAPSDVDASRDVPKPSRAGTTVLFGALVLLGGAVAAYAVGVARQQDTAKEHDAPTASVRASTAPAQPTPAPTKQAPAPIASTKGAPAPIASVPKPASPSIPPEMGLLKTAAHAPGRRIFVDGVTVGETPASVLVKCGAHTVMIGSSGRRQPVDIPCGAEIGVER